MTEENSKLKTEMDESLKNNLDIHHKSYAKLCEDLPSGEAKFMWEALNRQHEQSKKMREALLGSLAGGIKPGEIVIFASPHPTPKIKHLYYSNTRFKDQANLVKIFEDVDRICLPSLIAGTTPFPASIAQYLESVSRSNISKSNIVQHLHIKVWYCKKGKKNPFRDLEAYAGLYQLVKEQGQLNIDDARWTIEENTEPYIPPKALQTKSVKHLQRTIRQLDKRLLHPGSNRYVKIHLCLMRSLTVHALEMKKEEK